MATGIDQAMRVGTCGTTLGQTKCSKRGAMAILGPPTHENTNLKVILKHTKGKSQLKVTRPCFSLVFVLEVYFSTILLDMFSLSIHLAYIRGFLPVFT